MNSDDILSRPTLAADHRIRYGEDACHFGDLWIPGELGNVLAPLVIFFHGGWWKSKYDLSHAGYLCRALKHASVAVWSVEYRRVGQTGGGWPHTFLDAAAGADYVRALAAQWPLDLSRVCVMGHSAGGHLAFWVAGSHPMEAPSILAQYPRVPLRAAIALAGAVDLRLTIELAGEGGFAHDRDEVSNLMGGLPTEVSERYSAGNPGDLLPLGTPQMLIQGSNDDQIPPELPQRWAERARRAGDSVEVTMIPGADHLDVIDPESRAWPVVLAHVRRALLMQVP